MSYDFNEVHPFSLNVTCITGGEGQKKASDIEKLNHRVMGVVIDSKKFYYLGAIVGTIEVATAQIPCFWHLLRSFAFSLG